MEMFVISGARIVGPGPLKRMWHTLELSEMKYIENFDGLKELSGKCDIYIFGADIVGKLMKLYLDQHSIRVKAFLDNNGNKCRGTIDNISILQAHPARLQTLNHDDILLVASTYILDIADQLESHGLLNWAPIYQLLEEKIGSKDEIEVLPERLRKNHVGGSFSEDFDSFVVANMIESQRKYLDEDLVFIRSVDIILTEKCSLKCRDCANLMQFYEKPINLELETLKKEIDDITALAHEVNEIRIIGGEPLVNKQFGAISAYAAAKENVAKVVIYTNGTIVGSDEQWLLLAPYTDKVFVMVTSYGALSRNIQKLEAKLSGLGVEYNVQDAYGWTECGDILSFDRDFEERKAVFRNCCARHFTTYTDGKLFRCPFAANAFRLGAIPDDGSYYADISDSSARDIEFLSKKRSEAKYYLRDIEVLSACDFCRGRTYGDPEIVPGIQVREPRKYEKVT